MPLYLVERYVGEASERDLQDAAGRLDAASRATGGHLDLTRSLWLPGDEMCFLAVAAETVTDVERACEQAAVSYERVVVGIGINANGGTP